MDQVRTIDAGAPPARFARGWHCLGLAGRFRDGGPHAVAAFGTKLVIFADSGGQLHVLDAYCRHMGGDLSQGTVKGDAIACPFHDWRWGGDGRCAAVPYARRIPVAARTRSWRTLERNGQLFVWHDAEGHPPPQDVTIPRIDGAYSDAWTDWTWDSILVEGANCREVVDNVVDMAHFFYVHFAFPTFFKNVFEGHIASQYLRTRSRPDVGGASNYSDGAETTLRSEASYFGPSYMIDNLWHDYHGMTMESVLVNCHPFQETPVPGGPAATLSLTLDGATTLLPWPAGTRMLDALIGAGPDAPYSCRQGICGACACQLTGGEVEMAHKRCSRRPTSPTAISSPARPSR